MKIKIYYYEIKKIMINKMILIDYCLFCPIVR